MSGLEGVTHALTLMPPWAVLVVEGPKSIENRTWKPPEWVIGKRIAIHAGKREDRVAGAGVILDNGVRAGLWTANPDEWKFQAVRGAIIGTAVVAGYRLDDSGLSPAQQPWFFGPIGWLIEDRLALAEAIPCRGALGLWQVPEDLRRSAQEGGAR